MVLSMKWSLSLTAALSSFALATPVSRDVSNFATGMDDVITGQANCSSIAVIFARGTFDSGNIGFWVGPALGEALSVQVENKRIDSVAFQGMNEADYSASIEGYIQEGGNGTCADGIARTVNAYAEKCPTSKIVIVGWSQGALCAHKGLNRISEPVLQQVKGLVTFGDPNALWDNISVPSSVKSQSYCIDDLLPIGPDLLCSSLLGSFHIPDSKEDPDEFFDNLRALLPDQTRTPQQKAAAEALIPAVLSGATHNIKYILSFLVHGTIKRMMLNPAHFLYGNNGDAAKAAEWIAGLQTKI